MIEKIESNFTWQDLVLNKKTLDQVKEIEKDLNQYSSWLQKDDLKKKSGFQPGYSILFTGASGTGKTMVASLLGKYSARDVYRIDMSKVVTKFIGETEKNLNLLFEKAQNKNWILFFDEADALFGKRSEISNAHEKFANQTVSYLLQRTENYSGLVILSTNLKNNIDDAFARRFKSHIYFPRPETKERFKLWKKYIPDKMKMDQKIDLNEISKEYDLTGSNIVQSIKYATLKTREKEENEIKKNILLEGILIELNKKDNF